MVDVHDATVDSGSLLAKHLPLEVKEEAHPELEQQASELEQEA